MADATLNVFRGDKQGGKGVDYKVPLAPGMVVLDALHYIQGHLAPDLAVRWNCKAGKCGSCSAEVNGRPRLTCKTRMDTLPTDKPIMVRPLKTFLVIKDVVTDVSWNFQVNKKIPPFQPRPGVEWKFSQEDADRVQVRGLDLEPDLGRPAARLDQDGVDPVVEELDLAAHGRVMKSLNR